MLQGRCRLLVCVLHQVAGDIPAAGDWSAGHTMAAVTCTRGACRMHKVYRAMNSYRLGAVTD